MKNEENIGLGKSFKFAVRIIKLAKYLREKNKDFIISRQILRSGTSIGANMEEADGAQTKKDFHSKISIAYKEAKETHYWLRLLLASDCLFEKMAHSMLADCDELLKIIGSIKHTVGKNLKIST
ncbi:MAG: four helix bundle protein [Lentisphaerae bacterium GWF2_44_16]|nr:MAG: four helix bundle protein [Lentisphaerae bacterium GWF2_44_16]